MSNIYAPQPYPQQKYMYVNPGRQAYINPQFIPGNQNYYQSPVISNPSIASYGNHGYSDPYQQYYQNYYAGGYGGYGYAGYAGYGGYGQQQPCHGCNQGYATYGYPGYGQAYGHGSCQGCAGGYQYPYQYGGYQAYGQIYGKKKDCGCGCGGAGNCGQYGFAPNKSRLTPNFPSKLGHSYVTSGDRVENKLVINEPVSESAPFQSQRRITYQPYTRKYFDYQDYIQYIPVQRSEWNYKKVMKQIDFVPQQYYENSVQMVPRQNINYKVRYLPVQQQILHVPQQHIIPKQAASQIQVNSVNRSSLGRTVVGPVAQSVIRNSVGPLQPLQGSQSYQRVENFASQGQSSSVIRPAQSTVQMVPNSRLQPMQRIEQTSKFGVNQGASYKFPSSGGVMIGSSSVQRQSNPALSSFGPGGGIQSTNQNQPSSSSQLQGTVQASNVIQSVFNQFSSNDQPRYNEMNQFRESGKIQSEDYNFDNNSEIRKKNSIVNKFDEEY